MMASPCDALTDYGIHTLPGDDLSTMLKEALNTEEQRMFVDSCSAYLQYHPKRDFVVDLEDVFAWIGFSSKDTAKASVVNKLELGKDYLINIRGENHTGTEYTSQTEKHCCETILMTVCGFKILCSAGTEKAKRVQKYYILMEEVLMEYTINQNKLQSHQLKEQNQLLLSKDMALEAETKISNQREAELHKIRTKLYEETIKDDHVYIAKERSELATDSHKIGKALDVHRREAQLNTHSAQGVRMIYSKATHNATIVEGIVKVAMRRYHLNNDGAGHEHYNNNIEHSVDVIDIACTMMDTLTSSFEYISRAALFQKLFSNLKSVENTPPFQVEDTTSSTAKENETIPLAPIPCPTEQVEAQPAEAQITVPALAIIMHDNVLEWFTASCDETKVQSDLVKLTDMRVTYNEAYAFDKLSPKKFEAAMSRLGHTAAADVNACLWYTGLRMKALTPESSECDGEETLNLPKEFEFLRDNVIMPAYAENMAVVEMSSSELFKGFQQWLYDRDLSQTYLTNPTKFGGTMMVLVNGSEAMIGVSKPLRRSFKAYAFSVDVVVEEMYKRQWIQADDIPTR